MATSAKHVFLYFLVFLGMITRMSSSRVFKPQELEYQTRDSGKAERSAKLAFSGGIGIGIGIGEGSGVGTGTGTGHGGSIGYGQGSGSGGGSGHGKGKKSGGGGGIGIGIGGGFEWGSGEGEPKSRNSSECSKCGRGKSSSGHCCSPCECFECQNRDSGRCCPPKVTRHVQQEQESSGQKMVQQDDNAWVPSN